MMPALPARCLDLGPKQDEFQEKKARLQAGIMGK
jgi:hypothetical protein